MILNKENLKFLDINKIESPNSFTESVRGHYYEPRIAKVDIPAFIKYKPYGRYSSYYFFYLCIPEDVIEIERDIIKGHSVYRIALEGTEHYFKIALGSPSRVSEGKEITKNEYIKLKQIR